MVNIIKVLVYITTVSLYNLHCYMFGHFLVTIRQFTTNTFARLHRFFFF